MKLDLSSADFSSMWVDRSGTLHDHGREGFSVILGGHLELAFEDERDAERLARRILERLGIEVQPVETPK